MISQDYASYVSREDPHLLLLSSVSHFNFIVVTKHTGWCEDSKGNDQNSGVRALSSTDDAEQCRVQCQKQKDAKGCEYHVTGSCYVHTKEVASGNGNVGYTCWVFAPIAIPL